MVGNKVVMMPWECSMSDYAGTRRDDRADHWRSSVDAA